MCAPHTRTSAHAHVRTLAHVRTHTCTCATSHSYTLAHVRTPASRCFPAHRQALLPFCASSLDQKFAVTKGVLVPHSGAGPGCNLPMEYHAMLTDRLKNLSGGMELLWQLADYDFEAWLDGCVSSSDKRYWRYEKVEGLEEHGSVHVSFKTKLTDKATDVSAEFKPPLPAKRPRDQRQIDPQGVRFMLSYPDVEAGFNFKLWDNENEDNGPDAGWNRAKVEKDIKKVATHENFTDKQEFQTSDSLYPMPYTLKSSDGRSFPMHGMPIPWSQP
eukprot:6173196-Pleurochrysis_carterae.AAC.1